MMELWEMLKAGAMQSGGGGGLLDDDALAALLKGMNVEISSAGRVIDYKDRYVTKTNNGDCFVAGFRIGTTHTYYPMLVGKTSDAVQFKDSYFGNGPKNLDTVVLDGETWYAAWGCDAAYADLTDFHGHTPYQILFLGDHPNTPEAVSALAKKLIRIGKAWKKLHE